MRKNKGPCTCTHEEQQRSLYMHTRGTTKVPVHAHTRNNKGPCTCTHEEEQRSLYMHTRGTTKVPVHAHTRNNKGPCTCTHEGQQRSLYMHTRGTTKVPVHAHTRNYKGPCTCTHEKEQRSMFMHTWRRTKVHVHALMRKNRCFMNSWEKIASLWRLLFSWNLCLERSMKVYSWQRITPFNDRFCLKPSPWKANVKVPLTNDYPSVKTDPELFKRQWVYT